MDRNDNPFRPNGVLAKEADEIVKNLIQGKPISPSPSPVCDQSAKDSPDAKTKNKKEKKKSVCEEVEVNKSIIANKEASFAERVELPEDEKKKKKESLCCVVQ